MSMGETLKDFFSPCKLALLLISMPKYTAVGYHHNMKAFGACLGISCYVNHSYSLLESQLDGTIDTFLPGQPTQSILVLWELVLRKKAFRLELVQVF